MSKGGVGEERGEGQEVRGTAEVPLVRLAVSALPTRFRMLCAVAAVDKGER